MLAYRPPAWLPGGHAQTIWPALTTARLARELENGHYLVCHEGDGFVREYGGDGAVVWEYGVPLFGKERADGVKERSRIFSSCSSSAVR